MLCPLRKCTFQLVHFYHISHVLSKTMATTFEKDNFDGRSSPRHHYRHNAPNKTQRCRQYQLHHSLHQMNDCVLELRFDREKSRYTESHEKSAQITDDNLLVRELDRALLDAIACTVSEFCCFPSSPSIQTVNNPPQQTKLNRRPPCYGKESSPLKKMLPFICSDRMSERHVSRTTENTKHGHFSSHRNNNHGTLVTGLKKVTRYFKAKTSKRILLHSWLSACCHSVQQAIYICFYCI